VVVEVVLVELEVQVYQQRLEMEGYDYYLLFQEYLHIMLVVEEVVQE